MDDFGAPMVVRQTTMRDFKINDTFYLITKMKFCRLVRLVEVHSLLFGSPQESLCLRWTGEISTVVQLNKKSGKQICT